jgi:hypothetical protein
MKNLSKDCLYIFVIDKKCFLFPMRIIKVVGGAFVGVFSDGSGVFDDHTGYIMWRKLKNYRLATSEEVREDFRNEFDKTLWE